MQRRSFEILLAVLAIGVVIAGAVAMALLSSVGWLGVGVVGLAVLLIALRIDLDSDYPSVGPIGNVALMQRQLEQHRDGGVEAQWQRNAVRDQRHYWLYILRAIGFSLALLGLGLFAVQRLA